MHGMEIRLLFGGHIIRFETNNSFLKGFNATNCGERNRNQT